MERGKDLTTAKQRKIAGLSVAGWSVTKISKALRRSREVVSNYPQDVPGYGVKEKKA